MSLRSRVANLARTDPQLRRHLAPILKRALELPSFGVWAKTVLFMAKAERLEWLPGMTAKVTGDRCTVTVPFRYKGGRGRWKDAAVLIVIRNTPGVFTNGDRDGPTVETMIAGL